MRVGPTGQMDDEELRDQTGLSTADLAEGIRYLDEQEELDPEADGYRLRDPQTRTAESEEETPPDGSSGAETGTAAYSAEFTVNVEWHGGDAQTARENTSKIAKALTEAATQDDFTATAKLKSLDALERRSLLDSG